MKYTKGAYREYGGFLLVGACNTLLTYVLYVFFFIFLSYKLAYSLAYVCGIIISYYLNSRLVFREPISLAKFLQYPIVYVVQYGLGIFILYVCIDILGISAWLAPMVVIVISLPVTFVLSRLIIKGRA